MKFLCLHGTATNSDVLKDQLGTWYYVTQYCYATDVVVPLSYELGKHQSVEFDFLGGSHEVPGFPGLETHHPGPFFRYYGLDAADVTQVAFSMQSLSTSGNSPEDFSRKVRHLCPGDVNPELATQRVLEFARNSDLGPVDGLLSFSDGASVAANVLMNSEQCRSLRPFKCAILICGTPPFRPRNEDPYLADVVGQIISTPTLHILGVKDPGRLGGLALYNLCTTGTASLYEHGKGHEIPRVPAITKNMAKLIRDMIIRVEEADQTRS